MRYKKFKYNDNITTTNNSINKILIENNLEWLIDSEIENTDIEIKNKTIIWNDGIYYTGNWHYGIWKNGVFHGVWENGIWENGTFNGKWKSGIKNK
jgi:hypothetical protein